MNQEEKIKELQDKVYDLSKDINSSMQQLRLLQAELDLLRRDSGPGITERRAAIKKNRQDLPVNSPFSNPPGLENFIGLKLIHLVGIVVLVTGISIGVKYAIDKELISEVMRILLAYGAGIILFILSVRLKRKYLLFSAILFSGSMASFYFITYAAFVYYQFLPGFAAFMVMVALTVYTVIKAISYDRKEIAIIGMTGAYGIPFLISNNSERVDLFFAYILLINVGVVFISFKKQWNPMGYLSMLITWILFIGWGLFRYSPSQQGIAIFFIFSFYVLFSINALAFLISRKIPLSFNEIQQAVINNMALYLAAMIVFGNGSIETELPGTTGFMFLLSGLLALISTIIFPPEIILQRVLTVQSLLLLLLFSAFQWYGLIVTLLWVTVSVLLFIWGIAGQKSWVRLMSVLLMGITLAKLLIFDSERFSTIQKIICYIIIGILLLLFSFYYQRLGLLNSKESKRQ